MTITTEQATVYRGGGRRWFTKKSAINAEAKALFRKVSKEKSRCDCDSRSPSFEYFMECGEYICELHTYGNKTAGRYLRYAKHILSRSAA